MTSDSVGADQCIITHESDKYIVRTHRPGDVGYVVYRHAAVYTEDFGINTRFESLTARIGADFLDNFDASKERLWIAEKDGKFLGCIMVVNSTKFEDTAQVRLLLVEKEARGLGLGKLLAKAAVDFAKDSGYKAVVLWTQRGLVSARDIYQKLGFEMTDSQPHDMFGLEWVGENWRLEFHEK
ncbi:hypothetical protein VHEMI08696 [[Torrubiella] hemipterigena]|uniref:N-acetyltransferase domain-containing protein n=1 Tax=[Torrubiella] hemipterigena TaxID=1531966 RepID=A0A0A1TQ68_9HYPO|nr:hypothetical protein VHEMI08696 [[Torrubiella] hemipterigena]